MKEKQMPKTMCITGASGLVGSEAKKFFEERGWLVVGIDNNMRAYMFGTEKQKTERNIDIRDENAISNLFKQFRFDAVIHAAAQPSHDFARDNVMLDFSINAHGTLVLLEATRKYCPDAVFVHVSTDKVYGENMTLTGVREEEIRYVNDWKSGYREDLGLDFAGQRSLFGCSKTAADVYAQEYANYFGINVGIFRPGCITGKAHKGAEYHGFLAYLAHCIKHEKTYTVFGHKGKQVRDQIHASDLASAFWHFIQNPKKGGIYNIGGGPERSVSVIEAITLLEEATGKKAKIEFGPERQGDRIWDVHDVTKFRRDYPQWDYQYSLKDIIQDLV